MAAYIFTESQKYLIVPSRRQYHNIWEIGDGRETPFYVDAQALKTLAEIPSNAPKDCDQALGITGREEDATAFDSMLSTWVKNEAAVYRGMPSCHFAWEKLRKKSVLESEGTNDVPTFTMGNSQPTAWLPSAAQTDLAANVAVQCLDVHTKELAKTKLVPIGLAVIIHVGCRKNVPVCWLNPGEMVVKGPLSSKQFTIDTIVWLSRWGVEKLPLTFEVKPDKLFPVRPYEPKAAKEITDWYASLKSWFQWFDHQLKAGGFSIGLGSSV